MTREIFDEEHEAFRDAVGTFLDKEVVPHHDQWERDGIVDREVWAKAGAQGLLGLQLDEEYGGGGTPDFRYNVVIGEEMTNRGVYGAAFPLFNDMIVPYLVASANDEQRQRWFPALRERREDRRDRHDRAGRRVRPAGHPHHRRRRGRPLRAQRPEDLHLQRHPRRPGDRGRPHRPRGRPPGHLAAHGRARHGGLRARPQPRQGRPARPGHRRAVLRGRAGARRRTSSARRARASST